MRIFSKAEVREGLPWPALIAALRDAFLHPCDAPERHHHTIPVPGEADATLLIMPAWQAGTYLSVKLARVFPDNHRRHLPSVHADTLLCSAATGESLALIDGGELTARRTAAASALAADLLAPTDSAHLLMVGTGRLAPNLIAAHRAVRPITNVTVWGRTPTAAESLAAQLRRESIPATATENLEAAAASADIISCATLSEAPLIHGAWVRPGTHIDLVGAFKPHMRESDDELLQNAEIFVDTFEGALAEAGDLLQPLASKAITAEAIRSDLFQLVSGAHPGRSSAKAITVFKSVGTALEDLAAAVTLFTSS